MKNHFDFKDLPCLSNRLLQGRQCLLCGNRLNVVAHVPSFMAKIGHIDFSFYMP